MHITRTLSRTARRHPDATALVVPADSGRTRRELSYCELDALVDRVAGGLTNRGVSAGDTVGLFTDNCVEQVVTYVAAQRLGGVAVPINHRLTGAELAAILDDADAAGLLFDPERTDAVAAVREQLPTALLVYTGYGSGGDSGDGEPTDEGPNTGGGAGGTAAAPDWADPFADIAGADPIDDPPVVDPEAVALAMHTSGTTGRPKLVETTGRAQWANSLACVGEFGYGPDDVALHIAPLSHSAGYLNLLLPAMHVGATNVLVRGSFDPDAALAAVEREGVTLTLGVPTHFQMLRRAMDGGATGPTAYDLSSLRLVFTSGAPLADDVAGWITEALCSSLVNVYGLTETTGLVTVYWWSPDTHGEYVIGEAFIDVEVRLVRPESDARNVAPDETVPRGERGHLIARTPKLMKGYRGRPEETAATLRDGWLYTGDVAVKRSDGTYALLDRLDNVIITGGENVYPAEVERILCGYPGVVDAAVVGEPDDTFGERVVAYVVAAESEHVTSEDITTYWRADQVVAEFKRPRTIRFVESLPRNSSGKIQRDQLPDDASPTHD